MMNEVATFSLPKIGEAEKNIQDRLACNAEKGLAAIADGAGSSLYPGQWAEILVQAFCQDRGNPIDKVRKSPGRWLKPLQEEWRQYYLEKLRSPNRKWWQGGSSLKDRGSSTFLGLKLQHRENSSPNNWQAVAVGDSCLFKLEQETQQLISFPLQNSEDFKSVTPCFQSLPESASSRPHFQAGTYETGDRFLLSTDALSQWLLQDYENQGSDWKAVFELQTQADFVKFVRQLRKNKQIKNDDTTAILILTAPRELEVQNSEGGKDEEL